MQFSAILVSLFALSVSAMPAGGAVVGGGVNAGGVAAGGAAAGGIAAGGVAAGGAAARPVGVVPVLPPAPAVAPVVAAKKCSATVSGTVCTPITPAQILLKLVDPCCLPLVCTPVNHGLSNQCI